MPLGVCGIKLPPRRARWVASDCRPPGPWRLQLIGPLGRTRCLPYPHACRGARPTTCSSSRLRQAAHARRTSQDQGWSACPSTAFAPPRQQRQVPGTGRVVGSTTHHRPSRCGAPSRSRAPALSAQFARTAPPPSRTACRSSFFDTISMNIVPST